MSKKYICALFIILGIILCGLAYLGITNLVYSSLVNNNSDEIKSMMLNITEYTSEIIDQDDLKFLIDNVKPGISEDEIDIIESSKQYHEVLIQLRKIQNHFSNYCSFIYVVYQLDHTTYFIIGADSVAIKSIDKYSIPFNSHIFPYMEKALNEKISTIEPNICYDPQYKNWSISSYSPIWTKYGFLGVIGLDLEKAEYGKLLNKYLMLSIFISIFGLTCVVLTVTYLIEKSTQPSRTFKIKHIYKKRK